MRELSTSELLAVKESIPSRSLLTSGIIVEPATKIIINKIM